MPHTPKLLSNVQRAEVESKSQPIFFDKEHGMCCYQMYKELKLKANHNALSTVTVTIDVVIKCTKSWSWKQITTAKFTEDKKIMLLSNVQRAEVESKSQLRYVPSFSFLSCYQMYKELKLKANHNTAARCAANTNVVIKCTKSWSWKQITTKYPYQLLIIGLLSNVQRAEVESKSQL